MCTSTGPTATRSEIYCVFSCWGRGAWRRWFTKCCVAPCATRSIVRWSTWVNGGGNRTSGIDPLRLRILEGVAIDALFAVVALLLVAAPPQLFTLLATVGHRSS